MLMLLEVVAVDGVIHVIFALAHGLDAVMGVGAVYYRLVVVGRREYRSDGGRGGQGSG